jgi:uncharacterized protein (TIRG00374 family)
MQKLSSYVSYSLTLGCFVLFFLWVDWRVLFETLNNVSLGYLCVSFLCFLLGLVVRVFRISFMYRDDKDKNVTLAIVGVSAFYSYLLPMRSGELSLPLLLKKYKGVRMSNGILLLLLVRVFDLGVVAVFSCFVLLFERVANIEYWLPVLGLLMVALVGVLFLILLSSDWGLKLYKKYRFASFMRGLRSAHSDFFSGRPFSSSVLKILIYTLALWFFVILNTYFLMLSVGFDSGLKAAILVTIVMIPLSLLPVQGVANIGGHEFAWVAVMSMLGIAAEDAFNYSVVSHLILMLYVFFSGAVGFAYLTIKKVSHEGLS